MIDFIKRWLVGWDTSDEEVMNRMIQARVDKTNAERDHHEAGRLINLLAEQHRLNNYSHIFESALGERRQTGRRKDDIR